MQIWSCCGQQYHNSLEAFLHSFTAHHHKDVALLPLHSRLLLQDMVPMTRETEWVFWPDMAVDIRDMVWRPK